MNIKILVCVHFGLLDYQCTECSTYTIYIFGLNVLVYSDKYYLVNYITSIQNAFPCGLSNV